MNIGHIGNERITSYIGLLTNGVQSFHIAIVENYNNDYFVLLGCG